MAEWTPFVETEQDYELLANLAVDKLWADEPENRPPTESYDIYVKVFELESHWEAVLIPRSPGLPPAIMLVDDTGAIRATKVEEMKEIK
jgi:hypothetical protein